MGAVNGSLNECIRRYFFTLSSQRNKEAKKKKNLDLRLGRSARPPFMNTVYSFFNISDSYHFEISGRPKLVSVPFYILVTLRKVSSRASCKALRWHKVITIRIVCIVQYRIIFSLNLILLNGSITLIRAETERYDIVRFSKVTTIKSLASRTGVWKSGKPESGIGTVIGTGTGTGTGIRTVMERGTYIKIGTTIILNYFNLDLILI